jgi:glycosyltransferase involved in cell wall biosynthesis
MRLLHVIQDLGIGGTERLLEGLLPRFRQAGHEVRLFCLSDLGPLVPSLREAGIEVEHLGLRSYWSPRQVFALRRAIDHSGADVVHAHGSFADIFTGFACSLPRRRPFLVHHHTVWVERHPRRQFLAERFVAGRARRVVCISEAVAGSVVAAGLATPGATTVVLNGIDLERFPPIPFRARPRIVSVGSLTPHKGHRHLIEAVGRLTGRWPELELVLVGEGPERAALLELAGRLGLAGRVRLTGAIEDVRSELAAGGVFVLPSVRREGLGIALMEAMATRLPVVATRCGGIEEVVTEGTGLLVEPGDTPALAEAVASLLGDPDRAERLAEAGRRRVSEHFSLDRSVQDLLTLYGETVHA